jgi:Transposase, Mutator family
MSLQRKESAAGARAPEAAELIRQAVLRGISTPQGGPVVAVPTGESVSAQTVWWLTRVLHQAVRAFHQRRLGNDWAYLVLDGVWLTVRRAFGSQRVVLLVAYGTRHDATRDLWRSRGPAARVRPRAGRRRMISGGAGCAAGTCDCGLPMSRIDAGARDDLCAPAATALLRAQDAQHPGEGAANRRKTGRGPGAQNPPGRVSDRRTVEVRALTFPLAALLAHH